MSTPMDWQPSKAIQAKTGACEKNYFPGGSKTWKGDPGKNGMMKIKMKKETKNNKHAKALTTDAMSKVFMRLFQQAAIPFELPFSAILQRPALSNGHDASLDDGIPRRGTFASICPSTSHYVPNIPMFCLSLRNYVYKLPTIMHSQNIHTCIIMHLTCSCIW